MLPRWRKAKVAEIGGDALDEVVVEERAEPVHAHAPEHESVFDAERKEHMPDEMSHAEPWNTVH
jgi:hypothetical protein